MKPSSPTLALAILISVGVLLSDPKASQAQANRPRTDLNVAIFAYLPDASTAIKLIEERFERRYPAVDLDLELWNPHDDAFEDDGLSQIVNFDVVEIDTCRIEQSQARSLSALDQEKNNVPFRSAIGGLFPPQRRGEDRLSRSERGRYSFIDP